MLKHESKCKKIMTKIKAFFVEPKPDLNAQIAKRAYELYEQRGRQEGHANEDWLQAEREIHKNKKLSTFDERNRRKNG